MQIEALTSFCGVLCMAKGEVRDCDDTYVIADLAGAGYIREIRADPEKKPETRKGQKAK